MFDNATEWLKSTIPGLIVLGAIGSILAVSLLKILWLLVQALKHLFQKLLPDQVARINKWYFKRQLHIIYNYGYRFGRMTGSGDAFGAIVYFAYHFLCTLALLVLSVTSMIVTAVLVTSLGAAGPVTATSGTLVVASMLLAYRSYKHFLFVALPYRNFDSICKEISADNAVTAQTKVDGTASVGDAPQQMDGCVAEDSAPHAD